MADRSELEKDIDRLFAAPLGEFTSLRNALASRLKKAGLEEDAAKIKALAKPSVTAWAVNQIYYEHRDLFDQLRTAGERLRDAQLAQIGGKPSDVRSALDERRNALGRLTGYALAKLETSGHAATPEAERRINATLEAISVVSPGADAVRPGRVTQDMDPPGFDLLSAWMPGGAAKPKPPARIQKQDAKILLRQAQVTLAAARKRVKKAEAGLAGAEKLKRETDQQLDRARAASDKAKARMQEHSRETNEAKKALLEAEAAAARAIKDAEDLSKIAKTL